MATTYAMAEEAIMKLLVLIGLGVLILLGWVVIYALCRVSGIQSDREERRARYNREKAERRRDSW